MQVVGNIRDCPQYSLRIYHKAPTNAAAPRTGRLGGDLATGSGRADGRWAVAVPTECGCGSADPPPRCGLAALAPRMKPPDVAGAARRVARTAARMNVDRAERRNVDRVEQIAGRVRGTSRVGRTAGNTGDRPVVDVGEAAGRTRSRAGRIQRSAREHSSARRIRD